MLKTYPDCATFWHIIQADGPKTLRLSDVQNSDGSPQFEVCGLVTVTDAMSIAFDEANIYTPRDKFDGGFSEMHIARYATTQIRGEGEPGVCEMLVSHNGKILDSNRWNKAIGLSHVAQRERIRIGAHSREETIHGSTVPLQPWERLGMQRDEWRFVSAIHRQKFKVRRPADSAAIAFVETNKETLHLILDSLPRARKHKKRLEIIPAYHHESQLLALWEALERHPQQTQEFLEAIKTNSSNFWVQKFARIPDELQAGSQLTAERAAIYGRAVSILKAYIEGKSHDTRLRNSDSWQEKIVDESSVQDILCDSSELPLAAKALNLAPAHAKMVVAYAKITGNYTEAIAKAKALDHEALVFALRCAKNLSNQLTPFSGRAATAFMLEHHSHPLVMKFLDGLHIASLKDEWRIVFSSKERRTLPALEQVGFDWPWLTAQFDLMVKRVSTYAQVKTESKEAHSNGNGSGKTLQMPARRVSLHVPRKVNGAHARKA